jgi:hypothetical protein
MDALSIATVLTAISILLALVLWLPISLKARIRKTEIYLSGEPQSMFSVSITEVSWAVRRVFERIYKVLVSHVQTGVFNDWFALSLPYLLMLILLLVIVVAIRGGGV